MGPSPKRAVYPKLQLNPAFLRLWAAPGRKRDVTQAKGRCWEAPGLCWSFRTWINMNTGLLEEKLSQHGQEGSKEASGRLRPLLQRPGAAYSMCKKQEHGALCLGMMASSQACQARVGVGKSPSALGMRRGRRPRAMVEPGAPRLPISRKA